MNVPYYHVDAFADAPFAGNPAGVCVLPGAADAGWMQQFAFEMNLSEVAYLAPRTDGWDLRWFTPAVEVRLCGHATLASAHVLWESGRLPVGEPARFHTQSGWLEAHRQGALIRLDFPACQSQPTALPAGVAEAIGVLPVAAAAVNIAVPSLLLELPDERSVRELRPDLAKLLALGCGKLIVTARASTPGFDFVSRFFAPAVGVPEDPVTGSAHCALGPYWAAKLGQTDFRAYQASRRGGVVGVTLKGARVWLSGKAVTVTRGEVVR